MSSTDIIDALAGTPAELAELRAVANALYRLIRRGEVERGDAVRVLTDSAHAANRINGVLVEHL